MTTLLAPGGNLDMIRVALESGADAVYSGVRGWSRYPSHGLSDDDIAEALDLVRSQNKKFLLAMNSVPRMGELDLFLEKVERYAGWGIDGLIVNDIGILDLLHRRLPGLSLCASVGCGAVNVEDVLLLETLGAETVILPWTISPQDVERMRAASGVRLEIFVYGLKEHIHLGRCYLPGYVQRTEKVYRPSDSGRSSVVGSAKQGGVCYRICRVDCDLAGDDEIRATRLPYESFFIYRDLGSFLQAGVDLLKIQGRDLTPAHVGLLIRFYRHLLDTPNAPFSEHGNIAWPQALPPTIQYGELHELQFSDKEQGEHRPT